MEVAIIGANGMLGRDLQQACRAAGMGVVALDLPELDILRDLGALDRLSGCDWLVNCAAYTDVDGAESNRETAFAVNATGAAHLAAWCGRHDVNLLHISTDYVFDGRQEGPIKEEDPVRPLNVYGASKLAGETAVQDSGCRHIIVRTQSLFGLNGRNFVAAILARIAAGATRLTVVADQVSAPTYTVHLSEAILRLMTQERKGIVHVSAGGSCSWHAFAVEIARGVGSSIAVDPVPASEYPRAAARPAVTVLDNTRYAEWTQARLPHWQAGLVAYLAERTRQTKKESA